MARRRILAVLESRSTYGYSKNVLLAMRHEPALEETCLVTGMHLNPELGHSIDLIRADGFPIIATVPMSPEGNGRDAWSRALGTAITGYAEAMERIAPDIVILFGDRVETLGCCIAAAYMGLPVAHVQAGDKSGHIDDLARMAMAKLAQIHFASCEDSAKRLLRLGEQDFRIFNVGAPQLDDIVDNDYAASSITIDGISHDLSTHYILLMQHPVMVDRDEAGMQIRETLRACQRTGLPIILIYPNSDFGYRHIIKAIKDVPEGEGVTILENVERQQFLNLLANCRVQVGNSSSGIIEAPSFHVPVVNIGDRQRGRPQATNILNCPQDETRIFKAIKRALEDDEFRAQCASAVNPFGDGHSSRRICDVLRDIPIDRALIDKETVY